MLILGEWVEKTMACVAHCCPSSADAQLNILTRALVLGAKRLGVSKEIVIANLSDAYDREPAK